MTTSAADAAGAASAAVLAFLRAATAVFTAAWSEHQDASDDDAAANQGLASCLSASQNGSRLRAELAAVAAFALVESIDVPRELLRECAKIGQDVLLRLDRIEKSVEKEPGSWNLIDLVVLAERLDSLVQRSHALDKSLL